MNLQLIYPMFAMLVLTTFALFVMFLSRVKAVRAGKMSAGYFKTFSRGEPPESVLKTQRQFSNLFEVPVLFYAACIVAMLLPVLGPAVVFWAWFFVGARMLQALIHWGPNKLYPRMLAYALGWVGIWVLWILILSQALSKSI